jgi:Uma2 family endonuclease
MATAAALENDKAAAAPQPESLYEIVNGQVVEVPAMSAYSTLIASRIDHRLHPFVEAHQTGTVVSEMLFILDAERDLRRRPDVAFVSASRWPLDRPVPETGDWNVVPDLAVEVVSPNDVFDDLLAKLHEYFQAGVRQVWIVASSHKQVQVYDSPTRVRIIAAPDELDGGQILPGFHLPVVELFARQAQLAPKTS